MGNRHPHIGRAIPAVTAPSAKETRPWTIDWDGRQHRAWKRDAEKVMRLDQFEPLFIIVAESMVILGPSTNWDG